MKSNEREAMRLVGVDRTYGSGDTAVRALQNVSLSVARGEQVAIVGPSGSGKTTLLSVLALIDQVDHGEVYLNGDRVDALNEDRRADLRRDNIGLVFQLFHLIPALSALENAYVPLLPYRPLGAIRTRATDLLTRIGLGRRLEHRPYELSGGEQQRVAVARALISQPSVVLADEPTGNLDSTTAKLVVDMLMELQSEDRFALVVATHDGRVADRLGRCIRITDGAIVA